MVYKSFYLHIVIRCLIIGATSIWFSLEFGKPHRFYTLLVIAIIFLAQIYSLIQYINRINVELSNFFSALKDKDSNYKLSERLVKNFKSLGNVMNELSELILHARIEKEKQYQLLQFVVNEADTGMFLFNETGKIVFFNPAVQKLFGFRNLSTIEGLKGIKTNLPELVMDLSEGEKLQIKLVESDETKELVARASLIKIESEVLKLITVHNIRDELDAKEIVSWQKLIRVLTHEIMNSLAPINNITYSMQRSLIEGGKVRDASKLVQDDINKLAEGAEIIERRSNGLIDFVNNYRSFSMIKLMQIDEIEANEFFEHIIGLYREEFAQKNILYDMKLIPENFTFNADRKLIEQAIINLIVNGMEAMEFLEKKVIEISAKSKNSGVVIEVSDTGVGIEFNKLDDIFIPFFSTKENGSGIGLSLVRQIVGMHNGRISVHSVPGQGTKFTINI